MPDRILLHVCCAPCSIAVIDELRSAVELTVLFFNPNIFPAAEYLRRKTEVIGVCREWDVKMIDMDSDYAAWEAEIGRIPQLKEPGSRCSACYRQRLLRAAEYAKTNGFDSFASSLASGRQKKSAVINAIGQAVAATVGAPFLAVDWKKKGRWERGLALVEERGIYRQEYCGCRFSLEEAVASGRMANQPQPQPDSVLQSAHERIPA